VGELQPGGGEKVLRVCDNSLRGVVGGSGEWGLLPQMRNHRGGGLSRVRRCSRQMGLGPWPAPVSTGCRVE